MFRLDGSGPIYEQLARDIRRAVDDGRVSAGFRLPPSRTLASDLGISRTSVLAAYDALTAEGFLESRQGSGTFVARMDRVPAAAGRNGGTAEADIRIPERAAQLAAEQVRLMRQAPAKPDDIDLRYGYPPVDMRTLRTWRSHVMAALSQRDAGPVDPQGSPALRRAVAAYLRSRRDLEVDEDAILIVSGAQQALSLISTTLLERGARVLLEEPHYWGARFAFERAGLTIEGAAVGADGLIVDMLPREKGVDAIYVTPSHQFPTGAHMPQAARRALVDWAAAQSALIIEDDYNSEYRFLSRAAPTLFAQRRRAGVVYMGTFSNLLFPGLRLGYVVADGARIEALTAAKWAQDLGSDQVAQTALARFIEAGHFERHIQRNAAALRRRSEKLRDALERRLGGEIVISDSRHGMHFLVRAPAFAGGEAPEIAARAAQLGVIVDPADGCYLAEPPAAEFLVGFTRAAEDKLDAGAQRFASALRRRE